MTPAARFDDAARQAEHRKQYCGDTETRNGFHGGTSGLEAPTVQGFAAAVGALTYRHGATYIPQPHVASTVRKRTEGRIVQRAKSPYVDPTPDGKKHFPRAGPE